jgi:hypothetical protein
MSTSSPFFILKPQVKTRGWDKQPVLIPPQLLVKIHYLSIHEPPTLITLESAR